MTILNVMWAGGSAYLSTHKVHREILTFAAPQEPVRSWLLLPGSSEVLAAAGAVESLVFSSARLKGRGWRAAVRFIDHMRLRRRLLRETPRLVLLDGIGAARYLLPVLRDLAAVRVIVIFHGVKRMRSAELRLLQDFPAARLCLAAVSKALAEDVSRQVGLPVLGVRNAVEPEQFRRRLLSRDAAQAALGLPLNASYVLGAIGRLVSEKGFACLLQAAAPILQANASVHLVVLGEGPERAELEGLVLRHGVQAQVHLLGHVDNAVALYRAFDVVCIPSEQEGLGLVLQEAVIAGVPVLLSDLPVFREQLDESDAFIAVADVEGWRQAIAQLVAGQRQGLAGRQLAQLAPDQAWAEFQCRYRQLLSGY